MGWEVHEAADANHAARVVQRETLLQRDALPTEPRAACTSDNGAKLEAPTVLAMLHWIKISPCTPDYG